MHTHSFTLLRLFAAALVIVGHAYDLQNQSDIARRWLGVSLGTIGVWIFFVLSGYLIFNSASRNPDIFRYVIARALRILPGLWAMLVITIAVLAIFYSFDPWRGIKYIACNAVVFKSCYELPSVFSANPMRAINGSLWTLKYEAACYVGIGLLILTGLINRLITLPLLCAGWVLFFLLPEPHPQLVLMHQLGGCFLLGMVAAAICPPGAPPPQKFPDISYGLYIYAFPIQQGLIAFLGMIDPTMLVLVALILTAIPATFSWYLIEQPALSLKPRSTVQSRGQFAS